MRNSLRKNYLSFMGYSFKNLGVGDHPETTEKIFWALRLISDIFVDEYAIRELLSGRKQPVILDVVQI